MQSIVRRRFSSLARHQLPLSARPTPPRLPENEQKIFEELQRSSTGAFSTPRPQATPERTRISRPQVNQSPQSDASQDGQPALDARVQAAVDREEMHPDVRRGARPEFDGERNPSTGEVGGPKNEPLRWGGEVDWSYNGRVTDF